MAGRVNVFSGADHPVFLIDPANDRILDANPAACAFLGYSHDELLATPISAVHPAEMAQLSAWSEQALGSGGGWTSSFACRTKSGVFLPTEIELFAPDSEGRVFAFVRDRSERRAT